MRTIILLTVSFILIFIFATCNKEQPVNYTTRLNKQPNKFYGNPPTLNGIDIYSTLIGSQVCIPSQEEE